MAELLVFGSINLDLVYRCAKLPAPGETVLAEAVQATPGGKGANQAHAAALFGTRTRLVGAVGDDAFADAALRCLRDSAVDLSALQFPGGATGSASICVDARGENQIVVAAGANARLCHDPVSDDTLAASAALLLQMECDPTQSAALALRARRLGCRVVLNNAPAGALPPGLLQHGDLLIANRGELHAMLPPHAPADDADALAWLCGRCGIDAVLTLGARGAIACVAGQTMRVRAHPVAVRDTTGAVRWREAANPATEGIGTTCCSPLQQRRDGKGHTQCWGCGE
jgi:ribokinase